MILRNEAIIVNTKNDGLNYGKRVISYDTGKEQFLS